MTHVEFADGLKRRALGAENAMTAENIVECHVFDKAPPNKRELRALAVQAAEAGLPVIGGPKGYFFARSRKEAEAAIARLESHAKAELHHASVLKKILDDPAQGHLWSNPA